ncbi:PDZ domain (Also known as DHR or GLGF) domain-containing protein [Phthorimaea operculella]|nr:PDZ domain (Also known as DHR or GLGF) domain-containing protein [Phthorimaea operculella]
MELDVRLSRSGEEPWGFRLIGGTDFNMPLTVVKVVPNSPADAAGLRNGDTVAHIDGADSTGMSHEDSKKVLATAGTELHLGVIRGLYDMVLDDYDPVFEPIDQDDFDQPSQPTEVPLTDLDLDLTFTLPEFAQVAPNGVFKPLPDLVNGQKPDSSVAMDSAESEMKSTEENNITVTAPTEVQPVEAPKFDAKKYVAIVDEKKDPMDGYRPVPFDAEELAQRERRTIKIPFLTPSQEREVYKTPTGDIIGTHQGIVDGLEESVVDTGTAKELGKPGITEQKIAELISGEAEMLREAHVMGVDFNKIKPIVESLKDSEVLKALNEELLKDAEERKKKDVTKEAWTTFLQKPKRPVPRSKFGYYKDVEPEEEKANFNTGLLPWEERALREPTPEPVQPEEPILIPEEPPEIFEAVDPLPESEVPDLEDSGIPLPSPPAPKEASPTPQDTTEDQQEELDLEAVIEETDNIVKEKIVEEKIEEEMDRENIAERIMSSVQNMVDPNAPLEQQLAQMRAQLAALAQLPGVIQQSLELVTRQVSMMGQGVTIIIIFL